MDLLRFETEPIERAADYDFNLRFRYKHGVLKMSAQSASMESIFANMGKETQKYEGGNSPYMLLENGQKVYRMMQPPRTSFKADWDRPMGQPFSHVGLPNFTWMRLPELKTGFVLSWNMPWSKNNEEEYLDYTRKAVNNLCETYLAERSVTFRMKFIEEGR